MTTENLTFRICKLCETIPGDANLCGPCAHNREVINALIETIEREAEIDDPKLRLELQVQDLASRFTREHAQVQESMTKALHSCNDELKRLRVSDKRLTALVIDLSESLMAKEKPE